MRPLAPLTAAALVAGLLMASCSNDTPDTQADTIRFTLEEEMRIDPYANGLVPLNATRPLAVAEDGTIAVAQMQDAVVRFFGPDGEFLTEIGGRGEGPGEFVQVWRLGWMGGDTLWAYDQGLRRFTLIDPDLSYVRYIHVPNGARPGPALDGRFPSFSTVFGGALYADGSVYGEMGGPTQPGFGEHEAGMTTYGRIAEDGTILSYFQFSSGFSASDAIEIPTDQGVLLMSASFFPSPERPLLRLSDDGTHMAYLRVAQDGPDAGTFEVILEDVLASDTLYVRRYAYDRAPISAAMADSLLDDRVEGMDPQMVGPYRRGVQIPEEFPPIDNVEMAEDRSLWIRLHETEEGVPYRIHDPTGEPIGSVVVPPNVRINTIKGDRVWAIERDEFDVETVVRYRIIGLGEGA